MKVMTVVGTRPELIRLSRVMAQLEVHFDHVLVHTGQNYDHQLSEVFLSELELPSPKYFLEADTRTLGSTLGSILEKIEQVIDFESPDAFVILGDTNSAISAVMAKRKHVPIFHLEAGNRSFDENVPEETNRRMIDHISDFNLVYTEHARRNLISEGIHSRRIMLMGSPMFEVISHYRQQIESSTVLEDQGLQGESYILISAHREENVDNPMRLEMLLNSISQVGREFDCRVLMSTHPRTKNRIMSIEDLGKKYENILFHKPFGFFDYCKLQLNALCVLSDSGTISEESAMLGFPAVTLRDSIERPEALDSGSIITSGVSPGNVIESVKHALETHTTNKSIPQEYAYSDTSTRVVRYIQSVAPFHADWSGFYARDVSQ
jgi:UDP-N-acetylglucosamine 2-epimerase